MALKFFTFVDGSQVGANQLDQLVYTNLSVDFVSNIETKINSVVGSNLKI